MKDSPEALVMTAFRAAVLCATSLLLAGSAFGAEPLSRPAEAAPPAQPAALALDLAVCRRLARERQPALAAYRASLAKAEANITALENLGFADLIQKDLPCRRQQAVHGLSIARAQLVLGEAQTNEAVTRTYLTALLAKEQERLAEEGIRDITQIQATLKDIEGSAEQHQTRRLDILLELARGRKAEAITGYRRALAALAEAIGLESPESLVIAGDSLPDLDPPVDAPAILALTLQRRPELIMAAEFAAGAALEVQAQAAVGHALTLQTFAAGADIHAEPLPPGPTDAEYRPRPLGPEMPTVLAGLKCDRVAQARALSARAWAVVAKTRNLVTLEARNALLRWQELAVRRPHARKAADIAHKESEGLRLDLKQMPPTLENPQARQTFGIRLAEAIEAGLLVTLTRLEFNQARFDHLLVLATLERITAGGFCPGFE